MTNFKYALTAIMLTVAATAHAGTPQMPTRYVGQWCGKETNAGSFEYHRVKAENKCVLYLKFDARGIFNGRDHCPLVAIRDVKDYPGATGIVATFSCDDGHPGHDNFSRRMMNYGGDGFTIEPMDDTR